MGLGSAVGKILSQTREEMKKSANDRLYFDWTRNDALAKLLELHVRLAYVANHATYHPIARGDALLMDLELTAPRLEGLDRAGVAEWIRRKDKAVPYWFEAVSRYSREVREAQEHPELYLAALGEPNPVDMARGKLERFYNFWLYPPAKPVTEMFDKYYHVPDYVVVRELQQESKGGFDLGKIVDESVMARLAE